MNLLGYHLPGMMYTYIAMSGLFSGEVLLMIIGGLGVGWTASSLAEAKAKLNTQRRR